MVLRSPLLFLGPDLELTKSNLNGTLDECARGNKDETQTDSRFHVPECSLGTDREQRCKCIDQRANSLRRQLIYLAVGESWRSFASLLSGPR